ncbi:MAG: hypothetical protein ABGY24_16315, partial [bacterium]
ITNFLRSARQSSHRPAMYKYVALLVALLAFFASANAQHLGAHKSVSGVSAGVSGVSATSGKAGKGQHLVAGLEMLNAGLDDLAAKVVVNNLPFAHTY